MDRTERDLADLLVRRYEADVVPPPGLAARVLAGAAARRRRNRARGAAASAAVAVVVVAVGVLWPSAAVRTSDPVAPSTSSPTSRAADAPRVVSQVEMSRALPGSDAAFTAFAIDRDGTVSGTDVAYGPDGFDRFTQWLVLDPAPPEISRLDGPDVDFLPSLAADARTAWTLRHTDPANRFDLWCTDRTTGAERRLSGTSVWERSVRTDRGNVVWSTYSTTVAPTEVWTASGCGAVRKLPVSGEVLAVDWPLVYVRAPDVTWGVTVLDAVSLASSPVRRPDGDVPGPLGADDRATAFAAAGDVLAWVLGREVQYLDLRTGRVVRLPDLPVVTGANGTQVGVSVGDRTVAAFARGVDGGPDAVGGLVHDVPTGRTDRVDGDAWAAGPWVVTGDPRVYRVTQVR